MGRTTKALRANAALNASLMSLVRQVGWTRAVWALDFLAAWAIALRANNWEPITARQYGQHWKVSGAKAYRDLHRWQDLFMDDPNPNARILRGRALVEEAMVGVEETEHRAPSRDEVAVIIAALPAAA